MSSYKELTNSPAYNFAGETKWDIKTPSNGWNRPDGSVLLQSEYPKLFEKIGLIQDGPEGTYTYNTSTDFVLPADSLKIINVLNSDIYLKL